MTTRKDDRLLLAQANFDREQRTLWLTRPWGLVCLDAAPVAARVLDLGREGGFSWIETLELPLDLAAFVQLVHRSLLPAVGEPEYSALPVLREVLLDPRRRRTVEAWRDYCVAVGMRLCKTIGRYHPAGQVRMLALASRLPWLGELARTNPGLFSALVFSTGRKAPGPDAAAWKLREYGAACEPEAAARLGFPEGCVRLLSRIHPRAARPGRLARFRRALRESSRVRRIAAHLPRIDAEIIELLSDEVLREDLDNRVFMELATRHGGDPARCWLARGLKAIRNLQDRSASGMKLYRHVCSLRGLERLCDKTIGVMDPGLLTCQAFPSPPVPGEPNYVVPIRNVSDLALEGMSMGNCSLTYLDRVDCGEVYFYRGLPRWGLDRCTILIEKRIWKGCGVWCVAECRNRFNARCRNTTFEALLAFFADQQGVPIEALLEAGQDGPLDDEAPWADEYQEA